MSIRYYCPHCRETMYSQIAPSSGLGPSTLTCDVTGNAIQLDRRELTDMGLLRRFWYLLVSIIYSAIFSAWASFLVGGLVISLDHRPASDEVFRARRTMGVAIALFFLFIGLGVQTIRVRRSLRRSASGVLLTHRQARSGLSAQVSVFLGMIFIICSLAGVASLLMKR
jgi:hypothetical protein